MQAKKFNLLTSLNSILTDEALSIISGSFDQTKTNLVNRVLQQTPPDATLPGLGIAPVNFLSTADLSGTPNPVAHGFAIEPVSPSTTARVFIPLAPAAALIPIAYFTYNYLTNVWTYVGKMTLTMNTATVHTVRSLCVDDNSGGSTGWSIHLLTTNATVANGGYFYAPNISAADFTVGGGTTIASATTGDTQASKKVFWINETGGTNLLQIGIGTVFDAAIKTIFIGQATTNTIFYKFIYNTTISTVAANGMTTDLFSFKTGTNSQFGTALQTNCLKLAIPKSSQAPALVSQKCVYISTAAAGYHFLISDLSAASTTTPSQVTWNKLGTGVDYSAITWAQAIWSNTLDCEFNYSSTGLFMMKRSINNDPNIKMFGKNDPIYAEAAGTKHPSAYSGITIGGMFSVSGVLFTTSTVVGQRGVYTLNAAADAHFAKTYTGVVAPSFIITPSITVDCARAIALAMVNEYRNGSPPVIQFRTSSLGVFPGTWTDLPINNDLSSVGGLTNISALSLRIMFNNLTDYATNAEIINEIILSFDYRNEISEYWAGSVDNTTANGVSPAKSAFRLAKVYASSVPTLYFRAYDDSGVLVASANTVTNASLFEYSTNNGTSWLPLGTIPNTALTTELRYNWVTPPGVNVTVSLRES